MTTDLDEARECKRFAEAAEKDGLTKTTEYYRQKAILHYVAFIAETIAAQPSRETLSEIVNWTGEI